MHFIVFIWGFTGIIGALISFDAIPLVWHRMWLATLILLVYLVWKKRNLRIPTQDVVKLMGSGIIIALHWITFFYAIKISTVSVTLACLSTGAFFTSLLEPLFHKRKFDYKETMLGLVVILGLYLIFKFEGDYTLGIIIALSSALLSASFSTINGLYVKRLRPNVITTYELFGGWLAITFYLLFTGGINKELFTFKPCTFEGGLFYCDAFYLFILASVCTAYAFIQSVEIMKVLSPYSVMLTINLEPVYGIVLAYIFLGQSEEMSPEFYLGTLIIIATVFADSYFKKRHRKQMAQQPQ